MLFNSLEFAVFLPIVFVLYWFACKGRHWRNLLVVVASYVFYGWWDWRFLLLIVLTSAASFLSGILIERYEGRRRMRQKVSTVNIVLNIGILCVFKYYDFFVENLDALLNSVGIHLDWPTMNIILPVGISFYTFQALSYTIDVYRKRLPATRDFVAFCAYISFFPQLVAGPIERATNLLPQFQHDRRFDYEKARDGLRQMLWGFFKKVVVADTCGLGVNLYWNDYANLSSAALMMMGLLFTFQIYCDFSGYSDIAIGCVRLFGINLQRNFAYPYFSRSIPEFWRRWHISLMTWFRDYIYIPLGGSRGSRLQTVRNTLVVFAVSGLWHGANWTFVVWGIYHALLISLYVLFGWQTKPTTMTTGRKNLVTYVKTVCQVAFTFVLVVVGWIIFRAESLEQAYAYLQRMICAGTLLDTSSLVMGKQALLWAIGVMVVEYVQRHREHALQLPQTGLWRLVAVRWAVYYGLIALLLFCHGEQSEFIYFQF